MEEGQNTESFSILKILNVLKKNFVIMLAVIILCTGIGLVYALLRKPNYVAREQLNFRAELTDGSNSTLNNVTLMSNYLITVQNFCKQGVVVDRANTYWIKFSNEYKRKYSNWEQAFREFKQDVLSSKIPYTLTTRVIGNYISLENVSVTDNTEKDVFCFTLNYKENDLNLAEQKVKILALAYSMEIRYHNIDSNEKYFEGFTVYIDDLGYLGISSDFSAKRVVVIAFCVGVGLSLVAVYAVNSIQNLKSNKKSLSDEKENAKGEDK